MSWDVKISHQSVGDRTVLSIEASTDVPEGVISVIAGSYWMEQVQYDPDEWPDEEENVESRLQG